VTDPQAGAVDLHGHYTVPGLLTSAGARDPWRYEAVPTTGGPVEFRRGADVVPCAYEPMDADRIVDTLDALRIEVMALSVAPYQMHYDVLGHDGLRAARIANEAIAKVVGDHPSRFVGLGTLPLQDVSAAVTELEWVMSEAGMKGVELGTNVAGTYLGDERFRPVWEAIHDLGAVVFVHPVNVIGGDRLGRYFLTNLIGNPMETTRCIADLVFSGVLESFPRVKICVAHGGGAAPYLLGRWSRGFAVRPGPREKITRAPEGYLRMLYFDTITHSEPALRYLVDLVGADHVVIGTDYPFDMGPDDPVGFIERAPGLSPAEKAQIVSATARDLLGLS
jgi:aminocarboxymuconate-semialdehyde decarboxylase